MTKDIGRELDAILGQHRAEATQARSGANRGGANEENFDLAASTCFSTVVLPVLEHMVQALNERGVAARVSNDGYSARVDIPVSRSVRAGHGFGGYPYFRVRADQSTRRMYFERNTSGGIGTNAVANCEISEVNGDSIKAMVIDLVRQLYAPGQHFTPGQP